jgi:tetratricopeptide (TPR) repeat protein
MLRHLTRETGGAVFSVVGESEVAAAATAHTTRPWLLQGVTLEGATDLLVAGRPRVVYEGQRLLVTGRGAPKPGDTLVVELAQGTVTTQVRVKLPTVLESDLALRAYGELAVEQLEDFLDATEPQATAYARHFRVTGKSTSLLMLDTKQDYERFGIEPTADGKVVVEHPAAALVAKALDVLAERLGDPKAGFEGRLQKLASIPGAEVELAAELRKLLAALPRESYEVPATPLRTKSPTREGIPKLVLEQLAARTPEYDTLTAEAERRHREHGPADALKALSSLVEAQPGDGVLARDIGFSAMDFGLHDQAYRLFARVAEARPYEPQTYRAMALTLAAMDRPDLALAYFEIGLAGQWDARFGEFRQILLQDYLRFLRGAAAEGLHPSVAGYAERRATELRGQVDVAEADILVTITWNTDSTDVDLHVIEPSGEECFYSHPNTKSGGRLTRDVTQGYGPEMYVLAKAPAGEYVVRAKYFASDRNRASARTKVYATIARNWGRADEEIETKVVTLEIGKDMHDLATVGIR